MAIAAYSDLAFRLKSHYPVKVVKLLRIIACNRGPLRKVSGLFIKQMNSQAVNIGVHVMQVKGKKAMASSARINKPPIEVI